MSLYRVCRCSKELNQWEPLTEYGQSKGHSNPYLVLECAWRVSNWAAMKEALVQVKETHTHTHSPYTEEPAAQYH